jgi:hypothetical protein
MKRFTSILLVLLAGCAYLGITAPLSTDQKLYAAQGTVTGVVQVATTAVSNGTLPSSKAQPVLTMANAASALIQAGHADVKANNTAGASQELALVTSALTALQTYVTAASTTAAPAATPAPDKGQ